MYKRQALHEDGLRAVGHRVVHGGDRFRSPTVIDSAVIEAIEALIPLAPLHNPGNLAGIRAARAAFPDVPHVAVFDTAFHQSMPDYAYTSVSYTHLDVYKRQVSGSAAKRKAVRSCWRRRVGRSEA